MKVIICEDEILIAEHLKSLMESLSFNVIGIAHNLSDSLKLIASEQPDLALLDIRMEGPTDGIELGRFISLNCNFPFLFISASADKKMVDRALDVSPAGYIIKPFSSIEVYSAVQIAMAYYKPKTDIPTLYIKDGSKEIKLLQSEIVYLKSDNIYVETITPNKKYLIRNTLEKIASSLELGCFTRCHRSYIVNINYITEYGLNYVKLHGQKIPVSRQYQKTIRLLFEQMK